MTFPPTGTVTFLFTDIEGSTNLWEQHPEQMRPALARHDALADAVIAANGGTLVKSRGEGDSLFTVFARATDALQAACALQLAFLREPWPAEAPLHVRMALHTGEADLRDGDYFGPAVNRCARLRATAHGGQTLLSDPTQELVRDALPGGAALRDLGEHHLKDLGRPENVFQLLHLDLPADFPPLRSLDNPNLPHNLPQQPTSFVGREKEAAEVKALTIKSRLVTLAGSGGAGKSRLSLQVAADLLDQYESGAWLVELAPLSDPALVPQAVAQVLGVREELGKPLTQTLTDFLKPKTLLLVLDNCEHLLPASAALAADILRACPHVHLLASSREALGVAGEQTYRIPSLTLPERDKPLGAASLSQYEAVRLFIERAQSVRPDFTITDANAPAVAQVCWRLDGIPLAIELAAARVRAMPVEQVMARLDDRFRLLTGGSRTALPRQQTLQALIDWSCHLLMEPEKAVLRRLSVFAGGWTLEAAERVCAGDPLEDFEVLDFLTSLVDKSLVVYEEREDTGARYRLLETIRQYAHERLLESGEDGATRGRHRDYFLRLAEEAAPRLLQAKSAVWFQSLHTEHDNLRAALEWCLEPEDTQRDGAAELRFCGAMDNLWFLGSHVREARHFLTSALARAAGLGRTAERAAALRRCGFFAGYQGDYDAARPLLQEALAIAKELGDAKGAGYALKDLAWVASHQRDYNRARPLLEESRALFQESGERYGLAQSLHEMGILAEYEGDYTGARSLYEQVLDLFRELGNYERVVWTIHGLGFLALCRKDLAQASSLLKESLTMFHDSEDRPGKVRSLDRLANLALAEGQAARAVRLLGAADAAREAIGAPQPPSEHEEFDRIIGAARSEMDESAFVEAWAEGQTMSLDQAVEYALAGEE